MQDSISNVNDRAVAQYLSNGTASTNVLPVNMCIIPYTPIANQQIIGLNVSQLNAQLSSTAWSSDEM